MPVPFSSSFMLDVGILTAAALVFSYIMVRFGMPEVSGQIVAGMIVGPYVLGLVSNISVISVLSQLGIVLMMFIIGLELDIRELRPILAKLGGIALIEMGISFSTVFVVAFLLTSDPVVSLIIAVALSSTSTAVIGRLLLKSKAGVRERFSAFSRTLIGVSVVEDVVSVIFLVFIPGLSKETANSTLPAVALIIAGGLAILVITYLTGRYLVPLLLESFENLKVNSTEVPFLFSIALGIMFGASAAYLGFSPAIGSFLIGLSLRGKYSEFVSKQVASLHSLFVTLFFVVIGASIDPLSAFSTPLIFAAVLLSALLSKFIGGYAAGSILGSGALPGTLGTWLLPRAEFSMVIVQSAMNSGVIGKGAYSIVGIVVLITSLVGPLLLSRNGRALHTPAGDCNG